MNQSPLVQPPESHLAPRDKRDSLPYEFVPPARPAPPEALPGSKARAALGAILVVLCPARQPCQNSNCWAQPFCKCIRAEWASTRKSEDKVWVAIGIASLIVLLLALALTTY